MRSSRGNPSRRARDQGGVRPPPAAAGRPVPHAIPRPVRLIPILAIAAAVAVAPRLHAQQVDVIRGLVTDPERNPIPDVQVTATSISGSVSRAARTGKDGRFT